MISPDDIKPYYNLSVDYAETKILLDYFQNLLKSRKPFYINRDEFERILKWKLRGQLGRVKWRFEPNFDSILIPISKAVFSVSSPNFIYLTKIRLKMLTSLNGVGIPVASAVLALVLPYEYGVVDFRGWRQVFGPLESKKVDFSINDYLSYLYEITELANTLSWTVQEVDLAIWEYDRDTYEA